MFCQAAISVQFLSLRISAYTERKVIIQVCDEIWMAGGRAPWISEIFTDHTVTGLQHGRRSFVVLTVFNILLYFILLSTMLLLIAAFFDSIFDAFVIVLRIWLASRQSVSDQIQAT